MILCMITHALQTQNHGHEAGPFWTIDSHDENRCSPFADLVTAKYDFEFWICLKNIKTSTLDPFFRLQPVEIVCIRRMYQVRPRSGEHNQKQIN